MKIGQSIEYNMRNIFFKKSCAKCGRETSSRSFLKKSKLSISLDQQSEVSYSLFLLYVQDENHQNRNETKVQSTAEACTFISYKASKKKKRDLWGLRGLVPLPQIYVFLTFSGGIKAWHWTKMGRRLGEFIVNFEHISHLVLVFLLLTLSR